MWTSEMRRRFIVEKRLAFTVYGPVVFRGKSSSIFKSPKEQFDKEQRTQRKKLRQDVRPMHDAYRTKCKLAAMQAANEAGWEITENPLFLVIGVYLNFPVAVEKRNKKELKKAYSENSKVPNIMPAVSSLTHTVILSLIDANLFYKPAQVAGCLVVKKYDINERVEIMLGDASSFEFMLHDLRNA